VARRPRSAELCARLVRQFENLSLLRGVDAAYRMAPAYDLLCTALVLEDDALALPVGGNRKAVTPRQWTAFASYCRLTPRAAARALGEVASALEPALELIAKCLLPVKMKVRYAAILKTRAATLRAAERRAGKQLTGALPK
jgi:serine/threonine-protein kinase HipA